MKCFVLDINSKERGNLIKHSVRIHMGSGDTILIRLVNSALNQ